jgi:hypothetical protein
VKSESCTFFVGFIILLNVIAMAVQTDYHGPEWHTTWLVVNNFFLTFFVIEIIARLAVWGLFFFNYKDNKDFGWNIFDFWIVMFSVGDMWLRPLVFLILGIQEDGKNAMARYLMILRMFRIMRILRLLHAFPQLMKLVRGFWGSMRLVMWIAILMYMIILIFAIVTTDFIGDRADEPGLFKPSDREDIKAYWGTVMRSQITLFQYLTLDGWSDISRQVWTNPEFGWVWQIVFDVYVLFMAFVMLSLLTGVIADHMSQISSEDKEDQGEVDIATINDLTNTAQAVVDRLFQRGTGQCLDAEHFGQEFNNALEDGPHDESSFNCFKQPERTKKDNKPPPDDRGLNYDTFTTIMKDKTLSSKLSDLDVKIEEDELDDFWAFLDRNGSQDQNGTIKWEDLRKGLLRIRGKLSPKDMLRTRCAAERVSRRLSVPSTAGSMQKLKDVSLDMEDIDERISALNTHLVAFLESMNEE